MSKNKGRVSDLPLSGKEKVLVFAAFGDDNHGLAQNPVINHIAGLQLIDNGAAGFFGVFDFLNDLMEIGVENRAENFHFLNAEFVKNLHQFGFGEFDAFAQIGAVFVPFPVGGNGFNRAVKIVGNA